jgi:HPt (histidine-containing phosphotransfer) domain-containing protein
MAEIEAARAQDRTALGGGHHIKSPARMVGATRFADLCQTLEGCGKSNASIGQTGCLQQMHTLLERIGEQISKSLHHCRIAFNENSRSNSFVFLPPAQGRAQRGIWMKRSWQFYRGCSPWPLGATIE